MLEIRAKVRLGIYRLQLELRQAVSIYAKDETMSLVERRENIDLAVDHFIDQTLSIPELAIVDRGAKPPIRFIHPDASGVLSYDQAQQDMLKAEWVKEIK